MMSSATRNVENCEYVSPSEEQIWQDYLASERLRVAASLSGRNSSALLGDSDAISLDDLNDDIMFPPRYIITPPSPDHHQRSASQSSSTSTSYDTEMRETPFMSYPYNIYPSGQERRHLSPHDEKEEDVGERSFWSSVLRSTRSNTWSKGSKGAYNAPTSSVGPISHRVLFPPRRRSSSSSSSSTAQTKTSTGPKSILTRTPSNATTNLTNSPTRKSPPSIKSIKSVKFVEEPTVYDDLYNDRAYRVPPLAPAPPIPPRPDSPGVVQRLRRSLSKPQLEPQRPVISGPFPLWEASDRASCRSSIRSTRSNSSRLRTFWSRVTSAVQ